MNRYKLIRVVGEGSFGQAFLCSDNQTHMNVIVKEVNISEQAPNVRESSLNEAKILSKLKNPNIVKFVESFIEKGKLYIVMEYAEGGDLWKYIQNRNGKHIPEKQILTWIQQLCSALSYIHSQNILHRDLKSKNIFLDATNNAKLGDFGIAKVLEHTGDFAKTIVGSPFYLSPEICNGVPYDEKTDIWSLGCVIYEMCTLTPAFSGPNMGNVVMKILLQKQQPIPRTYSKELSKLVDSMLQKEPSDRPSLSQILKMKLFNPQTPKPPAKVKIQVSPPSHVLELNFQPETKKKAAPISIRNSQPAMSPRRNRSPKNTNREKISNCLVIQSLNQNACSKTVNNNRKHPIFKSDNDNDDIHNHPNRKPNNNLNRRVGNPINNNNQIGIDINNINHPIGKQNSKNDNNSNNKQIGKPSININHPIGRKNINNIDFDQPIIKGNLSRSTRVTASQNLRKSTSRKVTDKDTKPNIAPPKNKSSQSEIRAFLENKIGKGKMIKAYNDLKEEIIDGRDVLDYIGGKGNEYLIVLLQRLIVMEDKSEFICEKIL